MCTVSSMPKKTTTETSNAGSRNTSTTSSASLALARSSSRLITTVTSSSGIRTRVVSPSVTMSTNVPPAFKHLKSLSSTKWLRTLSGLKAEPNRDVRCTPDDEARPLHLVKTFTTVIAAQDFRNTARVGSFTVLRNVLWNHWRKSTAVSLLWRH